jgi:DNA-binding CsgD family transcriptional regulator
MSGGSSGKGFTRLGAPNWHARAELEARRISGRRGARDQLTEAETRVAQLVSEGLSNKQVAAQLFTSVATVESHLTRIYRKLDLRSRSEPVKRVAEGALLTPNA